MLSLTPCHSFTPLQDWVSGVDFHPAGVALASGAGDGMVKIWDFAQQRCVLTFSEHKQAVWGVRYHHAGRFAHGCMQCMGA